MNSPSVLIVGNFLSKVVGNRGQCEELATRLRERGTSIVTTSARKNRAVRMLDMVSTCWAERRRYDVAQVDVFSGPSFLWAEAVCSTLQGCGKPYVLALRGGDLPAFARRATGRVRRLLESADLVTAPSRYLQSDLSGICRHIEIVPNGLDITAYEYRPRPVVTPKLVWLRAFHRIYNPSLAVQVAAELRASYPETELVMAGPDKGDGSLERTKALVAALGLTSAVSFIGRVPKPEISTVINRGDIFLNTADIDNTPVTVLEAMACGACVVSTDVGGMPYLLDHGRNALVVPPNDPVAMGRAVRRILEDGTLSAALSQGARHAVEQMDWNCILPKWERVFSALGCERFRGQEFAGPRTPIS